MNELNLEPFEWSESYATGIRLIDNDHRELFTIIEDLRQLIVNQTTGKVLREVTDRLTRYAQEHFEREENLMAEYGYPGLSEHRKRHNDFVRMIYAIRKIELDLPERLDPHKLHLFLLGWLRRHILNADREYIPYLTGDYGRRSSDLAADLETEPQDKSPAPENEEAMISVTVQVPASQKSTIRRCAHLLRLGGDKAQEIEKLTDPLSSISLEDALEIAALVLRDPEPA